MIYNDVLHCHALRYILAIFFFICYCLYIQTYRPTHVYCTDFEDTMEFKKKKKKPVEMSVPDVYRVRQLVQKEDVKVIIVNEITVIYTYYYITYREYLSKWRNLQLFFIYCNRATRKCMR